MPNSNDLRGKIPGYLLIKAQQISRSSARWFDKFFRDDLLTQSAALSFYTALSLAPVLVLCLTLFAGFSDYMHSELIVQVSTLAGPSAGEAVKILITNLQDRPDLQSLAGWWSAGTLLVSASIAFGQLKEAMNRIFEVQTADFAQLSMWQTVVHFLQDRLRNLGLVLAFLLFTLVSLVFSSVVSLILSQAARLLGIVGEMLVSGLLFWGAFALVYRWLPRTEVPWPAAIRGAAFTGVAFGIGKLLIGIYLGNTAISSAYGAAGSLLVLLIWVYYSSLIIFIGAEVAFLSSQWRARQPAKQAARVNSNPASSSVRQSDLGASSAPPF